MADKRIEELRARLDAQRTASEAASQREARLEAEANERAVAAIAAWPAVHMMIPRVVDDVRKELGLEAKDLHVSDFSPPGEKQLGAAYVRFQSSPAHFVAHTDGIFRFSYSSAAARNEESTLNLVDLTPERFRDLVLEYIKTRLAPR